MPAIPVTPPATTSVQGKLKLAGDLGGTADSPTVPNVVKTNVANTFTVGPQTIQTGAAGNVGIIVSAAASQTADFQQWKNNSGTKLVYITADGNLTLDKQASDNTTGLLQLGVVGTTTITFNPYDGGAATRITFSPISGQVCLFENSTSGSRFIFVSNGGWELREGANTYISTNGSTQRVAIAHGNISSPNSILDVRPSSAEIGLIVEGASSQTATLMQLKGQSSTSSREMAEWDVTWATSTDASRKARMALRVYDTAVREAIRCEADGTYPLTAINGAVIASTALTVNGLALGNDVVNLTTAATNDDPNYRVVQNRVTTTDATVTTLDTVTIAASNTYLIEARVLARRTGGAAGTADDGAVYIRRAMVTTKTGTVTINAVQDDLTQEDQAAWDCTLDVNAATVRIRVTGAVSNNVTWHSTTIIQNLGT